METIEIFGSAWSSRQYKIADPPEWLAREPNAAYVTIPPDCLREAIWCNISHQVQALLFHGAGCLFPDPKSRHYRYTNPDTKFVLKEMAHSVLKPLGQVIERWLPSAQTLEPTPLQTEPIARFHTVKAGVMYFDCAGRKKLTLESSLPGSSCDLQVSGLILERF